MSEYLKSHYIDYNANCRSVFYRSNCKYNLRTLFSPIITLSVTIETSGWIVAVFKLIQALKYVIITRKYEKDPIKNSREKVETISLWGFFSDFKGSLLCSQRSEQTEIQTHPSSYACRHGKCKVSPVSLTEKGTVFHKTDF